MGWRWPWSRPPGQPPAEQVERARDVRHRAERVAADLQRIIAELEAELERRGETGGRQGWTRG